MIRTVDSTTNNALTERQQIAKSNNLDWDQYARKIEELTTNPPKQYAVTISYFPWYHGHELPAWQIPDLIATGVSPKDIGATYDKRVLVSEPYFKILQANVPGYLRDIQEIDPQTGKPLDTRNDHIDEPANGILSEQMILLSSTPTTVSQPTTTTARTERIQPASSSRTAHKLPSTAMATKQTKPTQPLHEEVPFDFTKLSPEVQRTTLQPAEQLLTVALQRLSKTDQLGAEVSSLLNRTA